MYGRIVSILLIICIIALAILSSANAKQSEIIGEIYLSNMESLLNTLSSIDKTISDSKVITQDAKLSNYIQNAVLINAFPPTLGISIFLSDLREKMNSSTTSIESIQFDIKKLYDALYWLTYTKCKGDPKMIYRLLQERNEVVKEFNKKLTD